MLLPRRDIGVQSCPRVTQVGFADGRALSLRLGDADRGLLQPPFWPSTGPGASDAAISVDGPAAPRELKPELLAGIAVPLPPSALGGVPRAAGAQRRLVPVVAFGAQQALREGGAVVANALVAVMGDDGSYVHGRWCRAGFVSCAVVPCNSRPAGVTRDALPQVRGVGC